AGVELALIASRRIQEYASGAEIHLFHSGERLMPTHGAGAARRARRRLERLGVKVHLDSRVVSLNERCELVTSRGPQGEFGGVMLTTSAAAPVWFRESGLATDDEGFLLVDHKLRSVGDDRIFGAGDCISIEGERLPKSGVYA